MERLHDERMRAAAGHEVVTPITCSRGPPVP
jgi:hypothetical protein